MTVKAGVEIQLKAETWIVGFARLNPGQPGFNRSGKLPYLIGVDSKHQQELFQ